jgi:hypothetical protein
MSAIERRFCGIARELLVRKNTTKRLSPYRRLEEELANARDALKNAVDAYMTENEAVRDLLVMVDASSFGGHKTYRCLTEFEVQRLSEIRKLVKP